MDHAVFKFRPYKSHMFFMVDISLFFNVFPGYSQIVCKNRVLFFKIYLEI